MRPLQWRTHLFYIQTYRLIAFFSNFAIQYDYPMTNDDNNSNYNLEDEDDDLNAPLEDSSEDLSDENEEEKGKTPSPLRLLFDMMINPEEGWKNIRRARLKADEVARRCFYPLTALASVSVFVNYIYGTAKVLNLMLIEALTIFISFFLGYFLVMLLERIVLPKECSKVGESDFGKQFVMYLLSTLTLFYVLYNCLPMLEAVLVFLPLWTIYLASKGVKFFRLPQEKQLLLTTLICILVVLSPIAIYFVFTELLKI